MRLGEVSRIHFYALNLPSSHKFDLGEDEAGGPAEEAGRYADRG